MLVEEKAHTAHVEDPEDVKGDVVEQVTLTEEDVSVQYTVAVQS
jgi:hypothetical protein